VWVRRVEGVQVFATFVPAGSEAAPAGGFDDGPPSLDAEHAETVRAAASANGTSNALRRMGTPVMRADTGQARKSIESVERVWT
jgi:hypothetical protein